MIKKILVVDEDQKTIASLTRLLMDQFHVSCANNSREGMERALSEKPDLIILDLLMPNKGGINLNNTLRENSSTMDIPVIFLTDVWRQTDETKFGCDTDTYTVFSKPFNETELLSKVQTLLRERRKYKKVKLSKPMQFSVSPHIGKKESLKAVCVDISKGGILIDVKEKYPTMVPCVIKMQAVDIFDTYVQHEYVFNGVIVWTKQDESHGVWRTGISFTQFGPDEKVFLEKIIHKQSGPVV